MIIGKEKEEKKFKSILMSLAVYFLAFFVAMLFALSVGFVSYKKITTSSPQAKVIIVEDEVVIEYKEIENENNID